MAFPKPFSHIMRKKSKVSRTQWNYWHLQVQIAAKHYFGSVLTVLVFAMVAGCSNSVIFFQVTWFKIRTSFKKELQDKTVMTKLYKWFRKKTENKPLSYLFIIAANCQELTAGTPGDWLDTQRPLIRPIGGQQSAIKGVQQYFILKRKYRLSLFQQWLALVILVTALYMVATNQLELSRKIICLVLIPPDTYPTPPERSRWEPIRSQTDLVFQCQNAAPKREKTNLFEILY